MVSLCCDKCNLGERFTFYFLTTLPVINTATNPTKSIPPIIAAAVS